jgi:hypothetical protein
MSEESYSVAVNGVNSSGIKLTIDQRKFEVTNDTFKIGESLNSGDLYVVPNEQSTFKIGDVHYDGNAIWVDRTTYPYYDDDWTWPWQPYVPPTLAPPVPNPLLPHLNTNQTISVGGPSPFEGWRSTLHSDRIEMAADVPGVDPNEIDLTISKGYVNLKGKRCDTGEVITKMHPIDTKEYDPSTTDAEVKNGVITVTILKRARRRPKRIKVKDANDGS